MRWRISIPSVWLAAFSGMGDVVGLVERAAETIDQEEAEKLAAKMAKGKFDLEDYAAQLKQITKMGSLSSIVGMLPGVARSCKEQIGNKNIDTKMLNRQAAIISSMTVKERRAAGYHQGEPQEAYRGGVWHHGAGCEPAAEAVRRHVRDDEADEQAGTEGPDAAWAFGADAARPEAVLSETGPF